MASMTPLTSLFRIYCRQIRMMEKLLNSTRPGVNKYIHPGGAIVTNANPKLRRFAKVNGTVKYLRRISDDDDD